MNLLVSCIDIGCDILKRLSKYYKNNVSLRAGCIKIYAACAIVSRPTEAQFLDKLINHFGRKVVLFVTLCHTVHPHRVNDQTSEKNGKIRVCLYSMRKTLWKKVFCQTSLKDATW